MDIQNLMNLKKIKSDIIEIYNRPNYISDIDKK